MESERLDLWLKHVCLYKHRSDATDAAKGGHVKLNGNRAKPAATVKVGDTIEITAPNQRIVVVLEIPTGNVSKVIARTMYRDETPEKPKLDFIDLVFSERDRGTGRPSKRDRREIEKWKK